MRAILDIMFFAVGFAVCWLCKDPVVRFVAGTEALVKSLEARLAALRVKS